MRVSGSTKPTFIGYVQVKVASRLYNLSVQAAPLTRDLTGDGKLARQPGFFAEGTEGLGILVDSEASDAVQRETIERASAEAERHISRKLLN